VYNVNMADTLSGQGCNIVQAGLPGSYSYSVAPDWTNRPVNYVGWGDAARFANWLHNGRPTGDQDLATTEDGAYCLNGATSHEALLAVVREDDWKWALPSEDEWYKAAYHKNDGVTSNYFDYPTSSDTVPSADLVDPDPGNNATFYRDGDVYTIGPPYYRTEAGAHENSESPYGTFDQGGNVWEWNEQVAYDWFRGLRGGAYAYHDYTMDASYRSTWSEPTNESAYFGLRVVEVPEPATLALLAVGAAALIGRSRRGR
jgi:formylglycine-generating enzyme required for sulfatase activity